MLTFTASNNKVQKQKKRKDKIYTIFTKTYFANYLPKATPVLFHRSHIDSS